MFNATFDPVENRWKAIQNRDMLRAKMFVENLCYHELSRDLKQLGYSVSNRQRGDFEIDGVSEAICERFSKRRIEVEAVTDTLIQQKPELAGGNLKELRSRMATVARDRKQKDLTPDHLKPLWEAQMTGDELRPIQSRGKSRQASRELPAVSVREAVVWAEEHIFDRHSVVPEFQIWQEALGRARGGSFELGDLKRSVASREYLRNPTNPEEITTREVLAREWEIVRAAHRDWASDIHWSQRRLQQACALMVRKPAVWQSSCAQSTWYRYSVVALALERALCCAS